MYNKVNPNLNFDEREKEVLAQWKKDKIFEKTLEQTEGGKEFSFYDGPPTANGMPHIGHILTRTMKDIIPRYKTMKGYHVLRKAGWDTHGLPVELEVEKMLGMDGKQDIEKYGIEPFIAKCKESVWKYKGEWEKMSDRVAYWVDMENPYITYDNNYIESVWWSLKEIHKKGLIYKGYKVVPYCPRCGTSLSSHEVAQGYKDVEEKSAVVLFPTYDKDTYILAWTTTPWTLPSNVALCFNPVEDYSLIEVDGKRYIMATALIGNHFENATIISTAKGKSYEGMKYQPLYNTSPNFDKSYKVVCDEYVTLSDGTGVVHIAPAFGEDDAKVGKLYDLPFLQMVDDRGKFGKELPFLEGKFCKDADKFVLIDLDERGLLKDAPMYAHSYPFCWRCDTPLLYYARSTWFIKTTAVKDKLIANNASVNWMPESIGKGRMGNFLENVIDWGLSRERYWGTPLPIWVCPDCGEIEVIGSKAELIERTGAPENIELHKPYVDKLTMKCSKCGGVMKRTPEVIDCWYDSGSMPFAQYHYPFENKEVFESTFPADFISEAVDQTRGWFYTLLAISTLIFDKAPFKNCIVLGHVGDKNGIKMSKHKGNVVNPWTVLDKQGADAVRWYFYTGSSPWLPSRFYEEAVSEVQRKYLGTLWNTYSFYALYAEIDSFDPSKYKLSDCALSVMDRWILSCLNTLVAFVDNGLNEYKITESARAMQDFVDMLSNWYVRRCRERYWGSEMTADKISAYMTLYTALSTMAQLTAPFTPFIAESIYSNIVKIPFPNAPESVHLSKFPVSDSSYIDTQLEKGMLATLTLATIGRATRNIANIKNRQPLSKVLVGGETPFLSKELCDVLKDELNVREVEIVGDTSEFVHYSLKPQLKTLGPKYGSLLGDIKRELESKPDEIVAKISAGGEYSFVAKDSAITLAKEDLLITTLSRDGFVVESDKGLTVILDTTITDELRAEGYMRELVSKIQTMRKESGFEVTDHINLVYSCGDKIAKVFDDYAVSIASDVLADSVKRADNAGKVWDINGESVTISLEVNTKR